MTTLFGTSTSSIHIDIVRTTKTRGGFQPPLVLFSIISSHWEKYILLLFIKKEINLPYM